jgi:hypothetical protein
MMDDRMRFRFWSRDLDGSPAHRDTLLPGRVVDRELKSTVILRGGISSQQAETFNRKIVTAVGRRILDEDKTSVRPGDFCR